MAKRVPVVATVKDGKKEVSLDEVLEKLEDSMDAKLRNLERKFNERCTSTEQRLGSCWKYPPKPDLQGCHEPDTFDVIDLTESGDQLEKGIRPAELGLQNFPGQPQIHEAFVSPVPQLDKNGLQNQDDADRAAAKDELSRKDKPTRSCSVKDFDTFEYSFDESIWDCALFIGSEPMGGAGSVFMLVLLLINITMQVLYALIVEDQFTNANFPQTTVDAYYKFRYQVAHDSRFLDLSSRTSLAARICAGDASVEMAGQQGDAYGVINKYLPEEKYGGTAIFSPLTGQLMCVVSLLMWCFTVAQEMRRLLDTVKTFRYLAKTRFQWMTCFEEHDGAWHLASLCPFRFSIIGIVVSIRLALAMILFIAGLQYLIYTINLRDLVLNAVALQCVLEVDEVMFSALAPVPVRAFLSTLQPIEVPTYSTWKGFDFPAGFFLLGVLTSIAVAVPVWLIPEVDRLGQARDALCGGEQDFVVTKTNYPPYIAWSNSTPVTRDASLAFNARAAETIVWEKDPSMVNLIRMGSLFGGAWSLKALSMWSVPAASMRFNPLCKDFEEVALTPLLAETYSILLSEEMKTQVKSCNEAMVKAYCNADCDVGMKVRTLCPVTCGCHSPLNSLLLTHPVSGCPPSCAETSSYQEAVAITSCEEPPPSDIVMQTRWIGYANALPTVAELANWPDFVKNILGMLQKLMLEKGCDAIPEFTALTAIDMCDESEVRRLPIKSLRLMCPKTCNCPSKSRFDRRNCPTACY